MKKCLNCESGELIPVEDMTLEIEGYVFIVKGERCTKCNEEFPYEKETENMIKTAQKLGIWPEPLKMYRHLSKSGNGLTLFILFRFT